MEGSYQTRTGDRSSRVSWSLCREGSDCASAPEPAPPSQGDDFDPCGRSGQQAALADTCRSQLDALLEQIGPAFEEYNGYMDSAERNRGAFDEAQSWCAVYDKTKELLEAVLTGGVGPAAEAGRSLIYLRDVIEKVQNGDLATMLYPSSVKTFLGHYKKVKAIWFELTADELAKMQRDHDACSGKVPIETYMAAKQFLADLDAAKRVWETRVAPGLNDLRSKGLECAHLDHVAWRACLANAECRGEPPTACGPEPSLAGAYDDR
jgi:hypothetical protein